MVRNEFCLHSGHFVKTNDSIDHAASSLTHEIDGLADYREDTGDTTAQECFVLPQIFGSGISQGDDLPFAVGSLTVDMSMCRRTALFLWQYVPETA